MTRFASAATAFMTTSVGSTRPTSAVSAARPSIFANSAHDIMARLDSSLSFVGLAPLQFVPIPLAPAGLAEGNTPGEDFGFVEALDIG
jgi:hypothetical protein